MGRRPVEVIVPRWSRLPDAESIPRGEPLEVLYQRFLTTYRRSWSRSARKNHLRTAELARALPPHPSPGDCVVWLAALQAGGMAASTAELHRSCLQAVFTMANHAAWAQGNPAALCPKPLIRKLPPKAIVNIKLVWPQLCAVATHRERAFLGLMRFAGLRRGEALALQPGHVLRKPRPSIVVSVQREPSTFAVEPVKESYVRQVPMSKHLAALFTSEVMERPKVWIGRGGQEEVRSEFLFPFRTDDLEDLVARLRTVAPLAFPPGKAWHVLRHTFSREAVAEKGLEVHEVSKMLGHADLQHTATYLSSILGRPLGKEVADKLDRD